MLSGLRRCLAPFACATAGLPAALGWRRWCLPLKGMTAPTKNPQDCGFGRGARGHRQASCLALALPLPSRSGFFLFRAASFLWLFFPLLPSFLLSAARRVATLCGRLQTRKKRRSLGWQQPKNSPPAPAAYRKSDSTPCGSWLAWATIAVPACCKIWARDRLAVSTAKSAS